MKAFRQRLSNWKLQNQILVSQLIIFALVFAFVLTALYVNNLILKKIFLESSMKMITQQEISQLSKITYLRGHLEGTFDSTMKALDQVNQMQQLTKYPMFKIEEPMQCLNDDNAVDTYSRNNTVCYGLYNNSNNTLYLEQIQQIKNSISLLNEFYHLTNLRDTQLAIAHQNSLEYFSIVKYVKLPQPFHPPKLPWYLLHVKEKKATNATYTYGLPFRASLGDIKLRIMSDLISKNDSFEGVISKEIEMSSAFSLANEFTLYLFDLTGEVIFGQQYQEINTSFLFTVYNESVTGFGYDDWLEIKNYSQNLPYKSNCQQHNTNLQVLCRFNTIFQGDSIIQVYNIPSSPYLMLLYQNNTKFIYQESQVRNTIYDNFQQLYSIYISVTAAFTVSLLIISYIGIIIVLKQTVTTISILQFNTKNLQQQIFSRLLQYQTTNFLLTSQTGSELFESIKHLIIRTKSQKKSDKCIKIENIKYWQIRKVQIAFAQFIHKNFIQRLSNYRVKKQINGRKIIRVSFKQLYKHI